MQKKNITRIDDFYEKEFKKLGFIAPTRLRGEETRFIFRANGFAVITTAVLAAFIFIKNNNIF